jgi:hypothetical protein
VWFPLADFPRVLELFKAGVVGLSSPPPFLFFFRPRYSILYVRFVVLRPGVLTIDRASDPPQAGLWWLGLAMEAIFSPTPSSSQVVTMFSHTYLIIS